MGKLQNYPAVFNIDVSVCMSCQICVEVCPFDAIEMDNAFELSTDDRYGGLLWKKDQLAKPNEYFHEIHPTVAAEIDERLAEAKAKLRGQSETCCGRESCGSSGSLNLMRGLPKRRIDRDREFSRMFRMMR